MEKSITNASMQPSSNEQQAQALIDEYHKISNKLASDVKYNEGQNFSIYLDNLQELLGRDFDVFKKMSKSSAVIEIINWKMQADYAQSFLQDEVDKLKHIVQVSENDIEQMKKLSNAITRWVDDTKDDQELSDTGVRHEVLGLANVTNIEISQEVVKVQMMKNLLDKTHEVLHVALPIWEDQLDALKKLYLLE